MNNKKPIKTIEDLDGMIDSLKNNDLRYIVREIAHLWFITEDGLVTKDKELGADELQFVTNVMIVKGITPDY